MQLPSGKQRKRGLLFLALSKSPKAQGAKENKAAKEAKAAKIAKIAMVAMVAMVAKIATLANLAKIGAAEKEEKSNRPRLAGENLSWAPKRREPELDAKEAKPRLGAKEARTRAGRQGGEAWDRCKKRERTGGSALFLVSDGSPAQRPLWPGVWPSLRGDEAWGACRLRGFRLCGSSPGRPRGWR